MSAKFKHHASAEGHAFTMTIDRRRTFRINLSALKRFADASGADPFRNPDSLSEPSNLALLVWAMAAEEDATADFEAIRRALTIDRIVEFARCVRVLDRVSSAAPRSTVNVFLTS